MVSWRAAYRRLRTSRKYSSYFSRGGVLPPEYAFDLKTYAQVFENVPNSSTAGHPGNPVGPLTQVFTQGAIVLGVSTSVFEAQQAQAAASYRPSYSGGNRDLAAVFLAYTDG